MVQRSKVVQLPILRGSSIADALSGFARQIEQQEHLGHRVEIAVTSIAAELRGWAAVSGRIGAEPAERLCAQVLDRANWIVESAGGAHVGIGGTPTAPVLSATFPGDQHAMRALVAAQRIRDTVADPLHPALTERFHACVGVCSGTIVHTSMNGSGLEFRSVGTVRMFATRLQEFAGPDQVFVAASTVQAVPLRLRVTPVGPVRTNGDGDRQEAYCLEEIVADEAAAR